MNLIFSIRHSIIFHYALFHSFIILNVTKPSSLVDLRFFWSLLIISYSLFTMLLPIWLRTHCDISLKGVSGLIAGILWTSFYVTELILKKFLYARSNPVKIFSSQYSISSKPSNCVKFHLVSVHSIYRQARVFIVSNCEKRPFLSIM